MCEVFSQINFPKFIHLCKRISFGVKKLNRNSINNYRIIERMNVMRRIIFNFEGIEFSTAKLKCVLVQCIHIYMDLKCGLQISANDPW